MMREFAKSGRSWVRGNRVPGLAARLLRMFVLVIGAGLFLRGGGADRLEMINPLHDQDEENSSKVGKLGTPGPLFGGAETTHATEIPPVLLTRADAVAFVHGHVAPKIDAASGTGRAAASVTHLPSARSRRAVTLTASAHSKPVATSPTVPASATAAVSPAPVAGTSSRLNVAVRKAAPSIVPTDLARAMRKPASAWDYAGVALSQPVYAPAVSGSAPQVAAVPPQPARASAPASPGTGVAAQQTRLTQSLAPEAGARPRSEPVSLSGYSQPTAAIAILPAPTARVATAASPAAFPASAPAAAPIEKIVAPVLADSGRSAYLPENNTAARPVTRQALDQLTAMAARVKPLNAAPSAYASAKPNSATAENVRDRIPTPSF